MKVLIVLATALVALSGVLGQQDDYCFARDSERSQTRHFTSKTAYQIIKGTNIDKQYLVPGCEPSKIWLYHRHGTRLPSKKTIQNAGRLEQLRDEIVKNYYERHTKPEKDALCKIDLLSLKTWKWNNSITPDQENYLTSQGYEDLRGTARTYQRIYPDILTRNTNQSHYKFRHTDTQRTMESFKAFAQGLFGTLNNAVAEPLPEKDLLLRPYDYCQDFKDQDTSSPQSENYKFRHMALWNQTVAEISKRLGFEYVLDEADIDLMYDMCRYDLAWRVESVSAWCVAFLPHQVTVLEYEDDMRYYYKLGYGYEANTKLSCHAAQDMLKQLNTNAEPGAVVYFAHSAGLQTVLAALGIAKDDIPLKADNYDEHRYRKWTISTIDPFASNLLAVKYQCPTDVADPEKVIFFLNQEAVKLDWCKVGLCSWSEVMKRYQEIYKADCDTYYCRSGAASLTASVWSGAFLLLVATVINYLNIN